jgi:hypothetical protein
VALLVEVAQGDTLAVHVGVLDHLPSDPVGDDIGLISQRVALEKRKRRVK